MDILKLDVYDLRISYKNFILKNISFSLRNGDIFGLMGRSGSGKSTLIKTIVGLKNPDKGSINFFINNIKKPIKKYLGYSPQENALFPFLTRRKYKNIWKIVWGQ
ncbi:MAG: ATP-binding cassette domain-containing protein [Candidatus Aenigmatarchaeota archaeon]